MAELNRFWDQLLRLIEDDKVVPVVGQDLLTIPESSGHTHLYPYLAARLAAYLEVSPENLPAGFELNEVASRFIEAGNPGQDVYAALRTVAADADAFPVPEPLLHLAAIRPLSLFISTTFDASLARALDQARFGGRTRTRVFAHAPTDMEDLPDTVSSLRSPVVYHLMGKLSAMPSYAVTQEDVIEFFHSLQSETRRPAQLFHELRSRSLLLLGTRFPGSLTSFLLRMLKTQPLSSDRKSDYVADDCVIGDQSLVLFLERASGKKIKIFRTGNAISFVKELHEHWMERHPAPDETSIAAREAVRPTSAVGPGAVFLSYASEDVKAADALREALDGAGMQVFFDKEQLEPGNDWEAKLRRSIDDCSLFVPVISANTLTPESDRFFRREWRLALERAELNSFNPDTAFLLPIVIDDTSIDNPELPSQFRAVQWKPLPGGVPTGDFVERVRQLYRRHQAALAGLA